MVSKRGELNKIKRNGCIHTFALFDSLNECLPYILSRSRAAVGSMDQHKVDVIKARGFQARLYLLLGTGIAHNSRGDLRGEIDLRAGQLAGSYGATTASLIAIYGGRIYVTIANVKCF